jgi:molybdopterin synthase sulfur carrier subunit
LEIIMPRVFIPPAMRSLVGHEVVETGGTSVQELIDELDTRYPGVKDRLCQGDQLRPGLVVAVNSFVSSLGLLERVGPDAEIHFLPALGGG